MNLGHAGSCNPESMICIYVYDISIRMGGGRKRAALLRQIHIHLYICKFIYANKYAYMIRMGDKLRCAQPEKWGECGFLI